MPQDLPYRRSAGVALINANADVFVGRRKKERDASLLVGFRMMPLEPQFQNRVEKKTPVGNEGFPANRGGSRTPAAQRPAAK